MTFPAGEWEDYFTGARYTGPCTIDFTPAEGKGGGLFVRRGAIIPTWKDRDFVGQYGDEEIILDVYPGGETHYVFREDDGLSLDYEHAMSCHTEITCRASAQETRLTIGRREGEYQGKCAHRLWKVRVHGAVSPVTVEVLDSADQAVLE